VPTQALLIMGLLPWLSSVRGRKVVVLLATLAFLVQLVGVLTDPAYYVGRTGYSYDETLFVPAASQIVGQTKDLLNLHAYSAIATRGYGLLTQVQTFIWAVICLALIITAIVLLGKSVRTEEPAAGAQTTDTGK
jgi:hypothetical protein